MHNDPTTLVRDRVMVSWTELGEGLCGEYNENDPGDVELLRFDVEWLNDDGDWEYVPDASYCTNFPVVSTDEQKQTALALILNRVYDPLVEGMSIKKICEELSWIEPDWVKINAEKAAKYIDNDGAYCPFCGSMNISGDHIHVEYMTRDVVCNDCNNQWKEIYKLVGIVSGNFAY